MSRKRVNRDEIVKYLREIYPKVRDDGIEKIGIFGSFAKESDDIFSDIDIVVKSGEKFLNKYRGIEAFLYFERLRDNISRKFGRRVDICDESGLKDKSIIKEAKYV